MTFLDPRTILVMSSSMYAAMSIVLFSAKQNFPLGIKGIGYWALGTLMFMVAGILYGARGLVPDWLSIACANLVMFWGVGFLLIGTQKFYGRPPTWWLFHLVWGIGIANVIWWWLVTPDSISRVIAISSLLFVLYFAQFLLIARYGERHFSTYLFGLLMLLQSAVVLIRSVTCLKYVGTNPGVLDGGVFNVSYLATFSVMAQMLTVGFMTAATRRLQILLEQRSNLDPLTGVLNRRGFAEIYAKEKARMKRDLLPRALLSIDLDFFKSINDHFGHAMGDRVLIHVASTIREALRDTDYVARFGGEEFIALLPDATAERALTVASRIQASVREARPDDLPAYTISIGIACQTSPEENLDSFLLRADTALYRAKAAGRDRVEVNEPAIRLGFC